MPRIITNPDQHREEIEVDDVVIPDAEPGERDPSRSRDDDDDDDDEELDLDFDDLSAMEGPDA